MTLRNNLEKAHSGYNARRHNSGKVVYRCINDKIEIARAMDPETGIVRGNFIVIFDLRESKKPIICGKCDNTLKFGYNILKNIDQERAEAYIDRVVSVHIDSVILKNDYTTNSKDGIHCKEDFFERVHFIDDLKEILTEFKILLC